MRSNHRKPTHANPPRAPIPYEPDHPNIQALFGKLYRVRMHQIDTQSIEHQRRFGISVTGNRKIDEAAADGFTFPLLSIAEMVDHYKDGVRIYITEPHHAKLIYEAICDHTAAWRHALHGMLNIGDAPIEDLIAMENFASVIYEKAKFEYIEKPKTDFAVGSLAEFLYSGSSLGGTIIGSDGNLLASGTRRDLDAIKKSTHEPNTSVFSDALMHIVGAESDPRKF